MNLLAGAAADMGPVHDVSKDRAGGRYGEPGCGRAGRIGAKAEEATDVR